MYRYSSNYYDNTRSGFFDVLIKSTNFYLKTLSTLITNNVNDDELSMQYNDITNYRGLNFSYLTNRFYIDYNKNFYVKPGIYNSLLLTVKKIGTIQDNYKETEIVIGNSPGFYVPKNSKFVVNGLFKDKTIMKIGLNCDTTPGRYVLRLENTDSKSTKKRFKP